MRTPKYCAFTPCHIPKRSILHTHETHSPTISTITWACVSDKRQPHSVSNTDLRAHVIGIIPKQKAVLLHQSAAVISASDRSPPSPTDARERKHLTPSICNLCFPVFFLVRVVQTQQQYIITASNYTIKCSNTMNTKIKSYL